MPACFHRLFLHSGISMRCVREEHTAINMNLHYLENGTVMLNFIYQKELFFLPLGFALKVSKPAAFITEQLMIKIL